jgi:acetylornithine deacetylase
MTRALAPVDLLARLVAARSISGSEEPAVEVLADALRGAGLEPRVSGRNVWTVAGSGRPILLLNAHLDTVPASPQWTRDPWTPAVEDGRMFGLGSSDDKASVAAMAAAVVAFAEGGFPGTLVFAATCDEETGGKGLEVLRAELPAAEAAVIGEPTDLHVATCQRGLIRIEAVAEGRAAHAARPHQGVNAVYKAMEDVLRLRDMQFEKSHPLLGKPTVTVTQIEGGTARNMVPSHCRFTVDCRTTPQYDNDWFVPELRRRIRSQVPVLRGRMTPVETPATDRIVRAALDATGTDVPVGFGGVSDLYHVRDIPAVVLGPGNPGKSHQPDESVPLDQVTRAAEVYLALARRWAELRAARVL